MILSLKNVNFYGWRINRVGECFVYQHDLTKFHFYSILYTCEKGIARNVYSFFVYLLALLIVLRRYDVYLTKYLFFVYSIESEKGRGIDYDTNTRVAY